MDWSNEATLRFLKLYRMHPCIWDPKNACHKNKNKLNEAWTDIKNVFGEPCTIKELKKKKDSLMAAYRTYRTKIMRSETAAGASGQGVYQPTWFAYSYMDSFLGSVYKCTASVKIEDNEIQQIIADSNYGQDDTSSTNTDVETDDIKPRHATATPLKRKLDPLELQQTSQQMNQTCNVSHLDEDEDECYIFAKLIALKMRKLSEDRRDLMMIKINELFYNECHERNRPSS